MARINTLIALTTLSLSLAAADSHAGRPGEVALIYQWEPGETITTRLTIEQHRSIGPLSGPNTRPQRPEQNRRERDRDEDASPDSRSIIPIDFGTRAQKLTCELSQRVAELDPTGVARIEMTITRLAAEADLAGDENFRYDSATPAKPGRALSPRASRLAQLVGRTMSLRVGHDGVIHDTRGMNTLAEALTLLQDDDALGHVLLEQAMQQDGGVDSLFTTGSSMLPRTPVVRGDQWSSETRHTWPLIGRINTQWNSTLKRLERKGRSLIATIESTAEIRPVNAPPGSTRGIIPEGIDIEMLQGTGEATTIFDTTAGRATSATMTLELPVTIRIGQSGLGTVDGVMQTLRTTMTHEVLPLKPPR